MAKVMRAVGSVIAGVALALVLVILVEIISAVVYPTPSGFTGTMEEMCAHVAQYPQWVLAVAVAAWGGTAFVSTWVTQRLGGRGCGIFVGVLLVAAAAWNVSMLPYYTWFKVAILIVIPVAVLLGLRRHRRREVTFVTQGT